MTEAGLTPAGVATAGTATIGGTLTASMDSGHDSPTVESLVNDPTAMAPMLAHDRPGPVPSEQPAAETSSADGLIAPLFDQPEPTVIAPEAAEPKPAMGQPASPPDQTSSPVGQTLADLEKRLHSPHTTVASTNPTGAMDMPQPAAPTTTDLPMPLISPLDRGDSSKVTAAIPPPVPPPFPPLPSANA